MHRPCTAPAGGPQAPGGGLAAPDAGNADPAEIGAALDALHGQAAALDAGKIGATLRRRGRGRLRRAALRGSKTDATRADPRAPEKHAPRHGAALTRAPLSGTLAAARGALHRNTPAGQDATQRRFLLRPRGGCVTTRTDHGHGPGRHRP